MHFWRRELSHHPDQQFAALILKGLQYGFRIGFNDTLVALRQNKQNLLSPVEHPEAVKKFIAKELEEDWIARIGPKTPAGTSFIHLNPLGAIPKKGRINQWRLIMDLSSPNEHSVNDGISKEICTCHYISVDQAVAHIHKLGQGSLMAKMDIKHAYRNIPVAPEDRHFQWDDNIYIDKTLPFGLRSAPFIFTAITDALLWVMTQKGVTWAVHYIDDFLTIGKPNSNECSENKEIMETTCCHAGLPIEPEKSMGPATVLTFLEIEIDSQKGELRLPTDKLQSLQQMLSGWLGKKAGRKRDLLSLIGSLSHACKVIRPGRIFLRRLIDLSTMAKNPEHFIHLNLDA